MKKRNGGGPTGPERKYAGVLVRFLATAIDVIVLAAVFFPVTRVVKGTWLMTASDHRWVSGAFVTDPLCLIFLLMMFLYFAGFEAFGGATPGKRALGLRVVDARGGAITVTQALLRNVLRFVDSLPTLGILAVVLISTSDERARFGDRVAETRVVRLSRGASFDRNGSGVA